MRRVKALATLVLGLGLAGMSLAADDQDRGDKKKGGDREFVQKASAAGLAELNLSQLAMRVSTNAAVQQFAQRLIQDHMRSNQLLLQIADRQRLKPAETMDKKHQTLMTDLNKAAGAGAQFDRLFIKHQVEDHEEAVKLFEREAKDGQNAALKQYASKTLPVLREHLKIAKRLADKLGVGEKGGGKGIEKGADRDRK